MNKHILFRTNSKEIIDVFFIKKKSNNNASFSANTFKAGSFKLHNYNFACDLHCRPGVDDIDLVSRSQVCQKHELQIACFSIFHTLLLKHCMVTTYIEKNMHDMICATLMYIQGG